MDEGRKRVLGIIAAILASLHMQTAVAFDCYGKISELSMGQPWRGRL
jgi:hypothetical protein